MCVCVCVRERDRDRKKGRERNALLSSNSISHTGLSEIPSISHWVLLPIKRMPPVLCIRAKNMYTLWVFWILSDKKKYTNRNWEKRKQIKNKLGTKKEGGWAEGKRKGGRKGRKKRGMEKGKERKGMSQSEDKRRGKIEQVFSWVV